MRTGIEQEVGFEVIEGEGQGRAVHRGCRVQRHPHRLPPISIGLLAKVEQTHDRAGLVGLGAGEEEGGHALLRRVLPA
jgi:hypothetical protein